MLKYVSGMGFEVTGFHNVLFPSLQIARVVHVYRQSGAPNENIVQNHLNLALLNVF